jgi:hypothetical protein
MSEPTDLESAIDAGIRNGLAFVALLGLCVCCCASPGSRDERESMRACGEACGDAGMRSYRDGVCECRGEP